MDILVQVRCISERYIISFCFVYKPDINECDKGINDCSADQTCNNTVGSFECLGTNKLILYSGKYWREENLAICS